MTPADLKALRAKLKWTQQQLADYLQVHKLTVSKWERGTVPIPHMVELALRQAELLSLPTAMSHTGPAAPSAPGTTPTEAEPP